MQAVPWEQVRDVVDQVLELAPAERIPYLDQACPEASVRRYVESLILSYEQADDLLDKPPIISHFSDTEKAGSWRGRRIGPYQIVEEIGEGGMGEVYLAQRADDQYRKNVAIKLVRSGLDSRFTLARFKAERQILANLDHPNIARLLDGGSTAHDQPYLVMEYVEGRPVDQHCRDQKLTVQERLRLFRTICSAVQYAHQNLVIHRDIKPANILVTSEGTPKLLDFGVAKILTPESAIPLTARTTAMVRLLTPEYASPEQLRGDPITTASDVYSLGVVLYEILVGRRPRVGSEDVVGLSQGMDLERPSAAVLQPATTSEGLNLSEGNLDKLRRRLTGDLDNIVLMALRHEPDRRYPSVERLSEDIRRHLEGLPVSARPDTLAYRSSKFVRRHKAGVVAASLLALSLVGGAAATLREARIARAQQQRAERRFNDVRTLANSLFAIQDSIEHLPGATPARKLVIDNALRYLDSLAREAEGDSGLERELANGYYRLGRVQGLPAQSNIGDTEGSLASFRKALALRAQVARANPQSIDDQLDLSTAHRAVSGLLAATGKAGAAEERELAVAIDQRLEHQWPNNRSIRRQLGRDYEALGGMEDGYGRWRKASEYFAAEYELSQTDARANPSDRSSLRALGVSAELLGRELGRAGLLDKGLRYINESLRIYQTLAADLNDAQVMRELAFVKESQAEIFAARGEYSRAVTVASEALTITQRLLSADPQNAMLRRDRAGSYLAVGRDLGAMGKTRRALAMLNQSVQLLEREVRSSPADEDLPYILSLSYLARADLLYGGRKLRDALADYRRAESELKKQVALPDNAGTAADLADVSVRLASSFARVGQLAQAEAEYRRALDLAKPLFEQYNLSAGPPLAESYAGLAKLSERQGAIGEACSLYEKSAAVWQRTPNPSLPDVSGLLTGNAATRRKLAACRAKAKRAVAGS